MKLVLALVALLSVASAIPMRVVNDRLEVLSQHNPAELAQAVISTIQRFTDAPHPLTSIPRLQDVPLVLSSACNGSLVAILNFMHSNPACFVPRFDNISSPALATFCASDCTERLRLRITNLNTQCTTQQDRVVFQAFADQFRFLLTITNALCYQFQGEYCFLRLGAMARFGGVPNQAALASLCTPCTAALFRIMAPFADSLTVRSGAYLELMCLRVGDQFCTLAMLQMQATFAQSQQTKDFSILCTPCYRAYIAKFIEISTSFGDSGDAQMSGLSEMAPMIKAMCTKDEAGQPCGRRMGAMAQQQSSVDTVCPKDIGPTAECSPLCAQEAARIKAALGCCLPSMLVLLGGGGPPNRPNAINSPMGRKLLQSSTGIHHGGDGENSEHHGGPDPSAFRAWFEGRCGLRLGAPCSGQILKSRFILRNLLFAYYQANRASVEAKIRSDLARNYRCTSDAIVIKVGTAVQHQGFDVMDLPGVSFDIEITPEDSQQSADIQAIIKANTALDLPALSTLPLEARSDPAQAVSGSVPAASLTVENVSNSAAGLSAGALSFVSVLLALVLARLA